MTERTDRRGFTLVEAAIVVVIIALILTFTIPWMRERERARLQAVADTEPWEVFEFRAKPVKEKFIEGEDVIIQCDIANLTNVPLTFPKGSNKFHLAFWDIDTVASPPWYPSIPEKPIAPGGLLSLVARFRPSGVGTTNLRILEVDRWLLNRVLSGTPNDVKPFQSNSFQLTVEASDDSKQRTFDEILAAIKTKVKKLPSQR